MNVYLMQTNPGRGPENLETLLRVIHDIPADLYVVPELFATGFDLQIEQGPIASEEIPGGRTCRQIQSCLKGRQSAVVCGLLEKAGIDFYNVAAVITADQVFKYRQRYPAFTIQGRSLPILPGDDYATVVLPSGVTLGLMVCNDYNMAEQFFEAFKTHNVTAVVLIADSRNQSRIREFPNLCQRYGLTAIFCNAAGEYKGGSCIIDAAGCPVPLRWKQWHRDCLSDAEIGAFTTI